MVGLVNFAKEPGSVELRELPVPEIGEEDVLLSVHFVGICGSDLHQFHGSHSWRVNYPVVLGHEFAGAIAKAGKRVFGFKEGDRVVWRGRSDGGLCESAGAVPPSRAGFAAA
jgi:D-arabinose 1-dehydrogenase-like Zn-dependent alcohol dehydrogenase